MHPFGIWEVCFLSFFFSFESFLCFIHREIIPRRRVDRLGRGSDEIPLLTLFDGHDAPRFVLF